MKKPRLTPAQKRGLAAFGDSAEISLSALRDALVPTEPGWVSGRSSGWRVTNIDKSIRTMAAKGWIVYVVERNAYRITELGLDARPKTETK